MRASPRCATLEAVTTPAALRCAMALRRAGWCWATATCRCAGPACAPRTAGPRSLSPPCSPRRRSSISRRWSGCEPGCPAPLLGRPGTGRRRRGGHGDGHVTLGGVAPVRGPDRMSVRRDDGRDLCALDLVALMIDGLRSADHPCVVASPWGSTAPSTRWGGEGCAENANVVTGLLTRL